MKVVEIAVKQLREAPWNPNEMDEAMMAPLRESLRRYGLVGNLVVRNVGDDVHEVLSGNQRLRLIKETGSSHAPCVVVDVDDGDARLLAQALNHIHGDDDLGLRAELLRTVLESTSEEEVAAILPGTAESLRSLAAMGQEAMAAHLQKWQQARSARLKHLRFQLTQGQLGIVEEAIAGVLPQARQARDGKPNVRGTALYLLCKDYLGRETNDC